MKPALRSMFHNRAGRPHQQLQIVSLAVHGSAKVLKLKLLWNVAMPDFLSDKRSRKVDVIHQIIN
jgi:hypothetical protein